MNIGAIIKKGLMDWQIIQQKGGNADITLSGVWSLPEDNKYMSMHAGIMKEDTSDVVIPWTACTDLKHNHWKVNCN